MIKKISIHKLLLLILLLFTFTSACQPGVETNAPLTSETQAPSIDPVEATSTHTPEPTLTLEPTATQDPLSLFLPVPIPKGLISSKISISYIRNDTSNALWFGPAVQAPQGEILHTSNWIYALAAPFPTLIDNISENEFQQLWLGQLDKSTLSLNMLYIPKAIIGILVDLWGEPDGTVVKSVEAIPNPDTLWVENAWAIIPFNGLHPKLKVISIDGVSPLDKYFNGSDYVLNLQYNLIKEDEFNLAYDRAEIQTIISGIQTTNRDPEKMTTLIMTGVTALVRATAYKMEMNGVTYPGEEIAQWLSEADITHISNEVSFYKDCPFPDPNNRMLFFCSDPKYIELFDYVGADIIELTGNHNNDSLHVYGEDVVPFTLDLYKQHNMKTYGGGINLEEAKSPTIITHNGNQIAFIGCNAPGPDFAWATETQGGAAPCGDFQWMIDQITLLQQEGILPIATLQYYEDYYNYAETHHIRDFSQLAEAGAAIVNGSQAHLAKGMNFWGETFIDYGLGNLFFDQMGVTVNGENITKTRWEIIQRHTIYDGRLLSTELLTAMLDDYAQPRPMTEQERITFLEELFTASGWISE